MADIGVGCIAWCNLLGLLFLVKPVSRLLADFEAQRKEGLDPVFIPEDCEIKGAELWYQIVDQHYSDLKQQKLRR